MDTDRAPRQCPTCGSRRWNDGEVAQADLYLRALTIRHLNPYRKPLSVGQRAAILRLKAERAATRTRKQVAAPVDASVVRL